MASPSSSRAADTRLFLTRGLLLTAVIAQAALAVSPLHARQATAEDKPAPAAQGAPATPPPVPATLDELIPAEAVDDPEGWAARGAPEGPDVSRETSEEAGSSPSQPGVEEGLAPFLPAPPAGLQPAIDAAFADFAIEVPEPLAPDPEVEALAAIATPVTGELPELADVRISDTLVLAFPAAPGAFPEQGEFIDRFRQLSTLRELDGGADSAPMVAARARADEELLGNMLRTYGYYAGEVVRQLSGGRRAGGGAGLGEEDADSAIEPGVRFDLLPGTRYRFGRIDLGALSQLPEPDGPRLREAFAIAAGDPLYADRIVERELELRVAMGESGYPFARIGDPDLLVDHARAEGDLTLSVDPGGKYVFGPVTSNDPKFLSGRHLARIARFAPGDVYRQSLETDLRRAIIATGLVTSVTITPRETAPPAEGQPGEVALDVAMERAPLRTIAGAIGYGTEDGFKLEGRWEHRNIFPPEGALRLRGILGTREALASIGVRRNNFRGRDQILSADLYASDIKTLAVDSRSFGLRTTFEKVSNILFQKPVSWQLGGELLYTDERNRLARGSSIPLPRQTYLIGGLFGSITLDQSDDLLDPSRGYRATFFLAPEVSRNAGKDSYYVRAQADASYYAEAGAAVLAARLRAASIQGADREDIAPSRRLYSGGGGSVRGYGFQGLGPRNDRGEAVGGASLVEASIEARIPTPLLGGAVEVVPFIDAGTVGLGSTPDFRFIQFGAGVGIRYKTSFGPIRVDVATPLNPTQFDSPVVVYVSLGQAF
ncbi:MAG: autotransporter assembly complex protein TamA [Erythrobacter sp.]